IKYAYDNWTVRPEYVLLFGDGDYDYKDIEGKHQNFIIPYETENSLNNIDSYTADDFYTWVSGNDKVVDLAIGRINVTTVQEAQTSVDKIIKYETGSDVGPWRNLITLVADDAYTSSEWEGNYHNVQSEDLSNNMIPASFDQKKIYEAMYPLVETSSGRRRPQVNQAIIDAVNSGTLILNWIGHGNPDVWAHEYVFEKTVTIPQLVNDKYCFLTAATCDFGRWDTPGEQSSTELMVLKSDGGIIGAFSSARTVYANENAALNNVFYTYLLAPDAAGLTKTLGKTFMLTKIVRHETNDLKYHLFGDPTMRLLVPQMPVAIDSINGVASGSVNVKALSKLRISGSVRNSDRTVATGANGECIMTVFDSERLVPVADLGGMQITLQGGTIYRGRVSISGGRFTTDFIVPKDISYQNEKGKVEAYVHSGTSDGIGYSKSIIVGGTDTTSHDDKKGPEVTIAFDQPDGDNLLLVKPTFNMYVKLKDQTGLNLTGTGIGHRLEAVLNGNESQPIDLTGEYTGDLDSGGKSGVAVHQFTNLQAGDYRIRVKAWDVFNNSTESEKSFTVSQTEGLVIKDVYNYPNPFKYQTTFTFQHNFSEPLDVKIKIYTIAGRMIKQIENPQVTDRFVKVFWDGKDQDGNMIANGTYLYKLIVRTISDSNSQEVLGKLAVIR
ncbi:MAG: type IX secretion system sortase PorU, partial [Clostridiales bacterium]